MPAAEPVTCATCELHAEAVFRVEGMDCNEEVVILERRLKPLPGLEALSADVIGQRLHVKYDAAKLTTSAMVDAVGQTGMRMWLEHDEPLVSDATVRTRLRLTAAAGAGIAAGAALSMAGLTTAAGVLYVAATLAGAIFPARRALTALRTRAIDINVLMVIAVAGALVIGELLEAATVVFLFALAQWLEVRTLDRARQAIRALMDLAPRQALVRRDGVERTVPVDELTGGDEVIVRPGDKIPVDGTVTTGHSDVNEAPITGESLPVDKAPGQDVFAGTINGHGALEIRVTRVGRDTRLARIIHLVEDAQTRRAPVQTFVDRFARLYTPAVIVLAVLIALLPPLVAGGDAETWFYRALVLLVISCPCALVISTPVSIVSALSAAARNGVLIKGGAYLERLADVRLIAFDKTGTLTSGELRVTDVLPFTGVTADDLLRDAAAVEARSEHPIARAIVRHAADRAIELPRVTKFASRPGLGAEADVGGVAIVVGNDRLLAQHGLPVTEERLGPLRATGKSLVFVAVDGLVTGVIAVADRHRETAREAVELLRSHGIERVVMLTGDHAETAAAVARSLDVDEHHAGLLPEQKHAMVESMRAGGVPVMMVGDGVNDAAAMSAATVGFAVHGGAEASLLAAHVFATEPGVAPVLEAIRGSRATLAVIHRGMAFSLAYNVVGVALAMSGVLSPLWAAVLMPLSSLTVVTSALGTRAFRRPSPAQGEGSRS